MSFRIATDVGGTFTDLVFLREGLLQAVKADTTPGRYQDGVLDAVAKARIELSEVDFFAHGSTVVINTLTERKGVRTALLTTRGFRDVLEIARGDTPDIFNAAYRKPPPIVPRHLRLEVAERMNYRGEVLQPLDLAGLAEAVAYLKSEGVEAIAISLLHAYQNPDHEKQLAAAVKQLWPEVELVCSHEVSRLWREYERTNTTAMSAYVKPAISGYLDRLGSALAGHGLASDIHIMKSNGGIGPVRSVRDNPISLVESGPVGGMLGAQAYGQLVGEQCLIALDIGGTTAKCSLINKGELRITTEYVIERSPTSAGYPLMTPVVEIVEIGNGGGSLAWIDAAGSLRVGPLSAGSMPGPVAYGRGGTRPTTTDANLYTGRINAQEFAGGAITPDLNCVAGAFAALGEQLGVSSLDAAHGVLEIANANMVNALKLVSVNQGHDPREFTLIAFGGGGALHATALAAELGIPKVIIPPFAGVFSAWGMLMLDVRRDYLKTHLQPLDAAGLAGLRQGLAALRDEAKAEFGADGFPAQVLSFEAYADARYLGQEHTVKVPVAEGAELEALLGKFHELHEQAYSYRLAAGVEVVNLHLVAVGPVEKSPMLPLPRTQDPSPEAACKAHRDVDFTAALRLRTAVYERARLAPGMVVAGPAIIEDPTTTTVVRQGDRVELDDFGGLHIHIAS